MGKTEEKKTEMKGTGKPRAPKSSKPPQITMTNNAERVITLCFADGKIDLAPGLNAVDRHAWEKVKKHPIVAKYMTQSPGEKKLVKGKPPILEVDESGPPSTKGKDVDDAVEIVKDVCDPDMLYEFESEDDRPKVRQAIDERRAEIGPTAVKEE
jgi:hypothetical protein